MGTRGHENTKQRLIPPEVDAMHRLGRRMQSLFKEIAEHKALNDAISEAITVMDKAIANTFSLSLSKDAHLIFYLLCGLCMAFCGVLICMLTLVIEWYNPR